MGNMLFSITSLLASTASGKARVNECDKDSNQEQKMYQKKSKNNPLHTFASRSPWKKFHLGQSSSAPSQIDSWIAQEARANTHELD
jgi:hypothetical protein